MISPGAHDVTIRHGGKAIGTKSSPLSNEDRNKYADQLLDLLGPMDVFDMFYRKTEVMARAVTRVLPTRERGEMLVKAVSVLWSPRERVLMSSILTGLIGCIDVSQKVHYVAESNYRYPHPHFFAIL